jgi:hypothetical protein
MPYKDELAICIFHRKETTIASLPYHLTRVLYIHLHINTTRRNDSKRPISTPKFLNDCTRWTLSLDQPPSAAKFLGKLSLQPILCVRWRCYLQRWAHSVPSTDKCMRCNSCPRVVDEDQLLITRGQRKRLEA